MLITLVLVAFCFCIVRGFEEEDSLENLHSVLICLTKKRSVKEPVSVVLLNYLCALFYILFSERRPSTLVQILNIFSKGNDFERI